MPTTISNITLRSAGQPLTANQMDTNITNIKTFAEATRATLDGLTNPDGSLSNFNGSSINNGTIEYGKLKNIFYANDTSSVANSIIFTVTGATGQTSISAGDMFVVKVNTNNTGSTSATITINSTQINPILLKKNFSNNLTSGQLKLGEIIVMIYDGQFLQVISDSPQETSTTAAASGYTDFNFGSLTHAVTREDASTGASTAQINATTHFNRSTCKRVKHGLGGLPTDMKAYLKCISTDANQSTHYYKQNSIVYFPFQTNPFPENGSSFVFKMFSDIDHIAFFMHGDLKLHYKPFDDIGVNSDPAYDPTDLPNTVKSGAFPLDNAGYETLTYSKWEIHILARV